MVAVEPGKPRKCHFLGKPVNKSGKDTELFWVALDSQHFCSKMGVATKGMTLNACSPLKSSRPTLPPLWSGKRQGEVREF